MEDVGEQQFLMLLLVMAAELDQRARAAAAIGKRAMQRGIDMRAIAEHLVRAPGRVSMPRAVAGMALRLRPRNSC